MNNEKHSIRIKTARKTLGYKNRDDFAISVDIPFSTLRAYEQGKIDNIPLSFFKKINETHGISIEWLLTGKGDIMNSLHNANNNPLSDIFHQALELSNNNDSAQKLKNVLEDFIDTESSLAFIRPKLKSLKEYELFLAIAEMRGNCNKKERTSAVFLEFIDHLHEALSKNLSQDNAKSDLLASVCVVHKPDTDLQDCNCDNLKEWIEKNLDNLDCFIILSNLKMIKDQIYKKFSTNQ